MRSITLTGTVTEFKGNGRKLGYPTANFAADTDAKDGVYFGFADLADFTHQPALIFIGVPTTVGDTGRRVEVHLLDIPDKDYYGLPVTVKLETYHRGNKTFAGIDELLEVMKADETAGREWFRLRATA
jgi:riboflavin kinase / FMN adenylyltransferase